MVFGFARAGRTRHGSTGAPARVPDRHLVYAIGDIHGRADLLDQTLERIAADAARLPDHARYVVYLGDYVDRGPDSARVIERLLAGPPPGFGAIHLKGNHEVALLDFLNDVRIGPTWFAEGIGGGATLASYGVLPPADPADPDHLTAAQAQFRAALPPAHRAFLTKDLRTHVTIGDYLFVHAGIRPGVPLAEQREEDLLWIRREFLNSTADHGKVVVHGHTIAPEPEVRANRIGIDTGAYATGRLTCLVLEGAERRFLGT
ncbi:MAG TPA: metallophosphoesterase family protein [Azospirillum sp.]